MVPSYDVLKSDHIIIRKWNRNTRSYGHDWRGGS